MTDRPEAGARRAAPCRIDWRHAAELLAQGVALTSVAGRLGCSRSQLSRKRNHDRLFQSWIQEAKQAMGISARDRNTDLRRAVRRAIEAEVKGGNVRVILWLADRLKLITPPSERTPEQELREILGGLSQDELHEFEGLRDTP
jgi:transposase-like protein